MQPYIQYNIVLISKKENFIGYDDIYCCHRNVIENPMLEFSASW